MSRGAAEWERSTEDETTSYQLRAHFPKRRRTLPAGVELPASPDLELSSFSSVKVPTRGEREAARTAAAVWLIAKLSCVLPECGVRIAACLDVRCGRELRHMRNAERKLVRLVSSR